MKEQIITFALDHAWSTLSLLTYSIIEYKIGISKSIPQNSLLEIIISKIDLKKNSH